MCAKSQFLRRRMLAAALIGGPAAVACFFVASALADSVMLDTGNALEGIVREEKDSVILRYVSPVAGKYQMKSVVIPRARITGIVRDPSYFEKYSGLIKGLASASAGSAAPGPGKADDSLAEAIAQNNAQVEENLARQRQHMSDVKFYNGWHEGYH